MVVNDKILKKIVHAMEQRGIVQENHNINKFQNPPQTPPL
jgi:hypothetical protein